MKSLVVACLLSCVAAWAGPERWEPNIKAFEAADQKSPPRLGEVLFVGSSTIVGWNLAKWLPDVPALNRGFGGSAVPDSVAFFDRVIKPYRPRVIVFYAGDNDIAGGRTAVQVRDDVATLLAKVRAEFPRTLFVWVPIKPSLARWSQRPAQAEANRLVAELLSFDHASVAIDMDRFALGADGTPRADLLKPDKLHFADAGYELLTAAVRPHLDYRPAPAGPVSSLSTLR